MYKYFFDISIKNKEGAKLTTTKIINLVNNRTKESNIKSLIEFFIGDGDFIEVSEISSSINFDTSGLIRRFELGTEEFNYLVFFLKLVCDGTVTGNLENNLSFAIFLKTKYAKERVENFGQLVQGLAETKDYHYWSGEQRESVIKYITKLTKFNELLYSVVKKEGIDIFSLFTLGPHSHIVVFREFVFNAMFWSLLSSLSRGLRKTGKSIEGSEKMIRFVRTFVLTDYSSENDSEIGLAFDEAYSVLNDKILKTQDYTKEAVISLINELFEWENVLELLDNIFDDSLDLIQPTPLDSLNKIKIGLALRLFGKEQFLKNINVFYDINNASYEEIGSVIDNHLGDASYDYKEELLKSLLTIAATYPSHAVSLSINKDFIEEFFIEKYKVINLSTLTKRDESGATKELIIAWVNLENLKKLRSGG